MARFFISYSRADGGEIANTIRKHIMLLDDAHHVFIDNKDILVAADWKAMLEEHIKRCQYFILILSPASLHSEWVKWEVDQARKSELESGVKKLFIVQTGHFELPGFIPLQFQVLKLTDNFTVDFFRLMSGIGSNQTFYKIREQLTDIGARYDVDLWIETDPEYKDLIKGVEYRLDYDFKQWELGFNQSILKENPEEDFKINFWTDQPVLVFVVIYLKIARQFHLIHKIEMG